MGRGRRGAGRILRYVRPRRRRGRGAGAADADGDLPKGIVMEAVLFVGLQASGKSTFYRERFFTTHLRINLDMLRTRHREKRLLEVCLETQLRFVVDNTNPTRADRRRYIEPA